MSTYSLILRSEKGEKLTIEEMDNNLLYLEDLAINSIGPTGPVGPRGYQGQHGYQGPQGLGYQGVRGYQGHQGTQGPRGFQGNDGPIGTMGYQGHIGVRGYQGYQGAAGPQGDVGPQGQGPQGVQGTAGVDGISWFQGTDNPLSTIPGIKNGDFYLKTTDNSIWQYSAGIQTWYNIGNIQGTQGVQGAQGTQGQKGSTGSVSLGITYDRVLPASGNTYSMSANSQGMILNLNAFGSANDVTLVLPPSPVNGHIVYITAGSTNTGFGITNLKIVCSASPSSGFSVFDAPTQLSTSTGYTRHCAFIYNSLDALWFRID